jgi:hypothetical protein
MPQKTNPRWEYIDEFALGETVGLAYNGTHPDLWEYWRTDGSGTAWFRRAEYLFHGDKPPGISSGILLGVPPGYTKAMRALKPPHSHEDLEGNQ